MPPFSSRTLTLFFFGLRKTAAESSFAGKAVVTDLDPAGFYREELVSLQRDL